MRTIKSGITVLLAAMAVLTASSCVAAREVSSDQRRDPVYAGLVGQWQGTVETRVDARINPRTGAPVVTTPSRRITHKTTVRVLPVPGSDVLEMRFVTAAGADTAHQDTNWLRIDKTLTAAQWGEARDSAPQEFSVTVAHPAKKSAPLELVLEGDQYANDCPSTIRETVTITPGAIRIVQETRVFGGEFIFQRAYSLRRVS